MLSDMYYQWTSWCYHTIVLGAPLQSQVAFAAPGLGATKGSLSQHTPYLPGPSPGKSGGGTSLPRVNAATSALRAATSAATAAEISGGVA